jgi:uncharacterized membrane protein
MPVLALMLLQMMLRFFVLQLLLIRCRQHMPGLAVNATTAAIAWYMTYMVHAGQIP